MNKKTHKKATGKIEYIATANLHFDPENPRFYRLNDPSSVPAVIEEMLDDEGAQDLMLSIGQKGYFEGEPLLITKDGGDHYIVVEGNRRLAATKLLNGDLEPPKRRAISIQMIREETEHKPEELPCIVHETRQEILRYLGYRHIRGVKEWDSLSKARYLAQLRESFYPDIPRKDQHKGLANDIGSNPSYVGKLLTALALYNVADNEKFFGLPVNSNDIEFSYITTALNYNPIVDWLGLDGGSDVDMPELKHENLKRAFAWMFSKDQQGRTILGESRNLKSMASIVQNEYAIEVLEKTSDLNEAFLYTDGPQAALQKVFKDAHEKLRIIWKLLPDTRPLTASHLEASQEIFEQSKDIRNFLKAKVSDEE